MTIGLAGFLAGCGSPQPAPRSFNDFMEDGLAREGVLARCKKSGPAYSETECANARRAAAAIAVAEEQARRAELERESEQKLRAMRDRAAREALEQERAAAAARAAAELAYERQWRDPTRPAADVAVNGSAEDQPIAAFGAPLGPVLPSMSESPLFDAAAESTGPSEQARFEAATAGLPASGVPLAAPDAGLEEITVVPRPFRGPSIAIAR
jgi:hypothetical protein